MVTHRAIGVRTLTLFWQLVIVTMSFWLWLFVWQGAFVEERAFLQRYTLYNEFLLIGILFGLGNKRETSGPRKEWIMANHKSIRQTVGGFFGVFLVAFAFKDNWISRTFFLSYLPWLYASLLFTNLWLSRALEQWASSGRREERVALFGTPAQAAELKPWLDRKHELGMNTVGLIWSEPAGDPTSPFPCLGTWDQVEEILRRQSITQLIVLRLSVGSERMRQLTRLCENAAVRMVVLENLNAYFDHNTTVFDDDGVRFIGLREEPLENPMSRFVKRSLDIILALPVVFLILPVAGAVVRVLHRFYSPGPLLFGQQRSGMLGQPFKIYKFRTMHVCNDDESRQATKNDPRIFPAGAWLRKLSIDELPQFINVVLGDMSIVGPRPHMPEHDAMFVKITRNYFIRRFIRPGITGWAQISGFRGEIHSEKDVQDRVAADIYYLENWSLSLDCLIIFKTIVTCISPPRSAY